MYQNKQVVAQQAAPIERSVHVLGDGQTRFFFFGTPDHVNVLGFALWRALHTNTQSPEKFLNVNDVKMPHESGFLPRGMKIEA